MFISLLQSNLPHYTGPIAVGDFVYFNDARVCYFCIGAGVGLDAVLVPIEGLLSQVGLQFSPTNVEGVPPGVYAIKKNEDGTISFETTIDAGTF